MLKSRAHKIEIKPTKAQAEQLKRMLMQTQAVKHWALEQWENMYALHKANPEEPSPTFNRLCCKWTQAKPECGNLLPRCSSDRCIKDVTTAYNNFFKNPKKYKKPSYRKKKTLRRYSMYLANDKGQLKGERRLKVPLISSYLKLKEKLRFSGKIMSYTLSTYAGKFWVSIMMTTEVTPLCQNDEVIGLDTGINHLVTTSDNEFFELPKERLQKAQKRIDANYRKLARMKQGSKNREKQGIRLQKAELRRSNIQMDTINKIVNRLAKTHGIACIQGQDFSQLQHKDKNPKYLRKLNREAVMGKFKTRVEQVFYRCIKTDAYFPSTQLCSSCGERVQKQLGDRTHECPHCHLTIDRDLNAAFNLKNYAVGLVKPDQIDF